MEISGRTVLLTGATGGIGHAVARALHARGARLLLTGRRAEVLEPLAAEVGGEAIAADLADRADVERLAALDADVLVANAALPASGDVLGFSFEEIDRALEVNLRAPIVLCRAFGERLAARGEGHLVLVSSLSGISGQKGTGLYSATKFGLRGFAQGLRGDLRARGVGVSAVFPGFIRDAGMFAEADVELPRGVGTSTPEEVAGAVVSAIERNRGEVVVAPAAMRVTTTFASLFPGAAASLARRLGGEELAGRMEEGQRAKR